MERNLGLLRHIADKFNGTAKPSRGAVRRSIKRMKTREGRLRHLELLEKHPDCVDITDKHKKTALYRAAEAGDTEVMEKILKAGIKPYFYHDAVYAAAHGNHQPALDLLLSHGAGIDDEHIEVTQMMADCYTEPGPEGEPNRNDAFGKQCYKGLDMLKAARAKQDDKRAADEELKKQVGPLVLTDKINVKGPLKLKGARREGFYADA
jgi:hypothetical protein